MINNLPLVFLFAVKCVIFNVHLLCIFRSLDKNLRHLYARGLYMNITFGFRTSAPRTTTSGTTTPGITFNGPGQYLISGE